MLAKQWKELSDERWFVAQIDSSFGDVVSTLSSMRAVRLGGDQVSEHRYAVTNDEAVCLFVAYSTTDSRWTFLESVTGNLLDRIPYQLSKKLKTIALACGFESSVGTMNYECFKNGTIIESCETGGPEFIDPQSDCFDCRTSDGKERKWIVNSRKTLRYFSKSRNKLDVESSSFEDYWADVSERIGVDVPYLNWNLVGDYPLECCPNTLDGLSASVLFESA